MTPLHWAVDRGNLRAVETLLKYSADVNFESKFDKTPLEIASDNGRPDIFEMLQVQYNEYKKSSVVEKESEESDSAT